MIDHISLPVADLERSKAFYDAALAPLDIVKIKSLDGEIDYGRADSEPLFAIVAAGNGTAQAPGFHVAFRSKDRATVDAFHQAALAAGAKDNGTPGLRPAYHPNYYAAFIIDPDGYHIEIVCHRPE